MLRPWGLNSPSETLPTKQQMSTELWGQADLVPTLTLTPSCMVPVDGAKTSVSLHELRSVPTRPQAGVTVGAKPIPYFPQNKSESHTNFYSKRCSGDDFYGMSYFSMYNNLHFFMYKKTASIQI